MTADTETDPTQAQQAAERLVSRDGADYLVGAISSSVAIALNDFARSEEEFFALGAYFAFALAVGAGVERFTIRPLYGRNPLYHILLTFGLVLIFKDLIDLVWGTQPRQIARPDVLSGTVELFGFSYGVYSYFVIGVGALVAFGPSFDRRASV